MDYTREQPTMDNPQMLARQVALDVSEEEDQVGDFVTSITLEDNVVDFRFICLIRGYEGWQWSVTLYHDEDRGMWSVDESSLVPTDQALRAPAWVPWKDRLRATDLSVTDSIGTDPDDARLEDGFLATADEHNDAHDRASDSKTTVRSSDVADETSDQAVGQGGAVRQDGEDHNEPVDGKPADDGQTTNDLDRVVEEFALTRRHVLSELGRSQTAKRWYDGPHGPKALSTRTADGNVCANCGFFIPLQGELGTMFGVCANAWGPDDGRVVSLDHGCGEHSEIEPPEPTHLWEQSEPAFDDMHIDVLAQSPKEERGAVELLELVSQTERGDKSHDDDDAEEADSPSR